jgi:hypothetical protein
LTRIKTTDNRESEGNFLTKKDFEKTKIFSTFSQLNSPDHPAFKRAILHCDQQIKFSGSSSFQAYYFAL